MTTQTATFPRTLSKLGIGISPLAVLLIVTSIFRLAFLSTAALWYDESGTLWMASLPFDKMIAATFYDTHPPLYLALMWVWVRLFGFSEIAARLPSVIISVCTVYLCYRLMRSLNFADHVALFGAACVAVLPAQIYYAQEARMYALLTAEFVLALIMAWRLRWYLLGASLALMYWTHNYGLIYAVPVNALAVVSILINSQSKVKHLAYLFILNVVAIFAYVPWLPALITQMQQVNAGYWIPPATLGSALDALYKSFYGLAQSESVSTANALMLFGLITFVICRSFKERYILMLLIVGLIPFATVAVASLMWRSLFLARGFVPAAVPLTLAAAAVVAALARREKFFAALLIVPVVAGAITSSYLLNPPRKGYVQPYLTLLADYNPETDIVVHANEGSYMSLHFYAPTTWRQYMLSGAGYKNIGALSDGTRRAMGFSLLNRLDDADYKRAWIIYGMGPTNAKGEEIAIANMLATHPHAIIEEHKEKLGMNAIYLVYNPKWSVP